MMSARAGSTTASMVALLAMSADGAAARRVEMKPKIVVLWTDVSDEGGCVARGEVMDYAAEVDAHIQVYPRTQFYKAVAISAAEAAALLTVAEEDKP
jgi:hypothetical protein